MYLSHRRLLCSDQCGFFLSGPVAHAAVAGGEGGGGLEGGLQLVEAAGFGARHDAVHRLEDVVGHLLARAVVAPGQDGPGHLRRAETAGVLLIPVREREFHRLTQRLLQVHRRAELVRVAHGEDALRAVDLQAGLLVLDAVGVHVQRAQNAVCVLHRRRDDVRHLHIVCLAEARRADAGVDAVGVIRRRERSDRLNRAEDGGQRRQIIPAHVEADACALLGQMRQELGVNTVITGDGRAAAQGLADQALVHDVFGRLHGGAEEGIGRDAQMQPLLVRDLHQLLALPEVDGDHLLTEHVLARQQRLLDDGIVGRGRGQADDHLDLRIRADLIEAHGLDPELRGAGVHTFHHQVAARDELHDRELPVREVRHVDIADRAAADDGGLDSFHLIFLPVSFE